MDQPQSTPPTPQPPNEPPTAQVQVQVRPGVTTTRPLAGTGTEEEIDVLADIPAALHNTATRAKDEPVIAIKPKYEVFGYVQVLATHGKVFDTEIGRIAHIDRVSLGKYRYVVTVNTRMGAEGWFDEDELQPPPEGFEPNYYL